jgi:cyclase
MTKAKELDVLRSGFDEIAPGVYLYMTGNCGPNSMVVVDGDDVLMVDALMTTKQSRRLLDALRGVTPAPVGTLVYTHRHGDHTLGAATFAPVPSVIGTPATADFLRSMRESYLPLYASWRRTPQDAEDVLAIPGVIVPNIEFDTTMTVYVGNTVVELTRLDEGHSPSDLLVHLPQHGVIATGDVWSPRIVPGMRDGRAEGWIKRLDDIYDMNAPVMVPGHGPWTRDRDFVRELRDFMSVAWEATKKGFAAGADVDAILGEIDLDAWSQFYGMNRYHEVIARMHDELSGKPSKYDTALDDCHAHGNTATALAPRPSAY